MRKILLLTIILLLCTAWVVAQTSSSPNPSGNQTAGSSSDQSGSSGSQSSSGTSGMGSQSSSGMGSQSSNGMGSQTSSGSSSSGNEIQGCLGGSSGNYTLTADSGTTYQLQGDDAQLSKHVGQEVKISGTPGSGAGASASTPGSSSSASSGSASAGASAGQTFTVSKVHKVASTCSNQGSSGSSNPSK